MSTTDAHVTRPGDEPAHDDLPHDEPGAPTDPAPSRTTALVLLVGGLVGAAAALTLLLDKIALLVDPSYIPTCNIDPLLSCGSIMRTPQSEILGFPNPIIGLATFPVVAVLGALLVGRVRLPGWCWLGLQVGVTAGVAFVSWLITQSVAVIGALCPWCMVVWVVTIAAFWYVTAHNLAAGRLEAGPPGRLVARRPGTTTAVTLLVVLAILVTSFPAWFAAVVGL